MHSGENQFGVVDRTDHLIGLVKLLERKYSRLGSTRFDLVKFGQTNDPDRIDPV